MGEKADKIEHIDACMNPLAPTANVPATSIDTRPRAPQATMVVSHLRGQGGLQMTDIVKKDPIVDSRDKEHQKYFL